MSESQPFPAFSSLPLCASVAGVELADALRSMLVVLFNVCAGAVPSNLFALPYPTKSTTFGSVGLVMLSVSRTSAIFPELDDIGMIPTTSGVGRLCVPPAPCAS